MLKVSSSALATSRVKQPKKLRPLEALLAVKSQMLLPPLTQRCLEQTSPSS